MHNEYGANIDNIAIILFFHLSHSRLRDEVSPFQVDINIPVEIFLGVFQERFQSKDPGIIDSDSQDSNTLAPINRFGSDRD